MAVQANKVDRMISDHWQKTGVGLNDTGYFPLIKWGGIVRVTMAVPLTVIAIEIRPVLKYRKCYCYIFFSSSVTMDPFIILLAIFIRTGAGIRF